MLRRWCIASFCIVMIVSRESTNQQITHAPITYVTVGSGDELSFGRRTTGPTRGEFHLDFGDRRILVKRGELAAHDSAGPGLSAQLCTRPQRT